MILFTGQLITERSYEYAVSRDTPGLHARVELNRFSLTFIDRPVRRNDRCPFSNEMSTDLANQLIVFVIIGASVLTFFKFFLFLCCR